MIYIANCYVGQYKPGEVFDADIPEKELKRLLAKKAITPTGKTFQEVLAENGMDDEGTDTEDTDNAADDPDDGADESEQETEAEEPEAPEIDVMDGISAAEEPEAEEVKPKGRRNRK